MPRRRSNVWVNSNLPLFFSSSCRHQQTAVVADFGSDSCCFFNIGSVKSEKYLAIKSPFLSNAPFQSYTPKFLSVLNSCVRHENAGFQLRFVGALNVLVNNLPLTRQRHSRLLSKDVRFPSRLRNVGLGKWKRYKLLFALLWRLCKVLLGLQFSHLFFRIWSEAPFFGAGFFKQITNVPELGEKLFFRIRSEREERGKRQQVAERFSGLRGI